jgi:hypothetical protein
MEEKRASSSVVTRMEIEDSWISSELTETMLPNSF